MPAAIGMAAMTRESITANRLGNAAWIGELTRNQTGRIAAA